MSFIWNVRIIYSQPLRSTKLTFTIYPANPLHDCTCYGSRAAPMAGWICRELSDTHRFSVGCYSAKYTTACLWGFAPTTAPDSIPTAHCRPLVVPVLSGHMGLPRLLALVPFLGIRTIATVTWLTCSGWSLLHPPRKLWPTFSDSPTVSSIAIPIAK